MCDQNMGYIAPFRLRDQTAEAEQPKILPRVNGNFNFVILDNKSVVPEVSYFQSIYVTYLALIRIPLINL